MCIPICLWDVRIGKRDSLSSSIKPATFLYGGYRNVFRIGGVPRTTSPEQPAQGAATAHSCAYLDAPIDKTYASDLHNYHYHSYSYLTACWDRWYLVDPRLCVRALSRLRVRVSLSTDISKT